jgi:uncharacterized protein YukE
METNQGSIAGAMAVAALDRAEALDAATVALQALVRKELAESQATLRREAAAMQAILRQEAEVLDKLRKEVARGVEQFKELQPRIEQSAGSGVRMALASNADQMRLDLARQVSDSADNLRDAAQQVKGMVRRLTPLWAGLIATGGLIVGILLMYFVMASWQRRIEQKIDRLPQALPLQVQPEALPPPPATGPGSGHQKTHGGHSAIPKPKTPQPEPAPATPANGTALSHRPSPERSKPWM